MIQAGTTFSKDVPPFIIAGGHPLHYKSPNKTMMTANDVAENIQKHVANAYRLVFHGQTSVFDACLQIKDQVPDQHDYCRNAVPRQTGLRLTTRPRKRLAIAFNQPFLS